ncbi:MAG: SGNH/GDSL hydrolase family protein [Clostridia bacterium]|nr:SGNH/GDSL hydrolase family protein [Clostridia bacterium]
MKTVVLIGDSIRLCYQQRVAELLGDGVKVLAPEENCRFTKYALWGMFNWMECWGSPEPDVIHWNTGIWDLHRCTADGEVFTPLPEYLEQNRRLAEQMESYCKNLIWATITPGGKQLDGQKKTNYVMNQTAPKVFLCDDQKTWNGDVKRYNGACAGMLEKRGIKINDLYSLVISDTDKYICEDGIHPSAAGIEAMAEQTADMIKTML